MKTPHFARPLLLLTALSMAALSGYSADEPIPGSLGTFNLAITMNFNAPSLFDRDEEGEFVLDDAEKRIPVLSNKYTKQAGNNYIIYSEEGSKIESFKLGTKELLQVIMEGGYFPEGETSISGWSVKVLSVNSNNYYYLMKKNEPPVPLPSGIINFEGIPVIAKGTIKTKVVVGEGKTIKSAKATGGAAGKGMAMLVLDEGFDARITLTGRCSFSAKAVFPAPSISPVLLLSMKSTDLAGKLDEGDESIYFEGSASISGVKSIPDVQVDFPAPEQ